MVVAAEVGVVLVAQEQVSEKEDEEIGYTVLLAAKAWIHEK